MQKLKFIQTLDSKEKITYFKNIEKIKIAPEENTIPTVLYTKIDTSITDLQQFHVTYHVNAVRFYKCSTTDFGILFAVEIVDISDTTIIETEVDLENAVQNSILNCGEVELLGIFTEQDIQKNPSILNNCLQDYLYDNYLQVLGKTELYDKSINVYYRIHE